MRALILLTGLATALVMAGCTSSDDPKPTTDSGTEPGNDSAIQQDAPLDTELDAPLDAELDAPLDAELDAPLDAELDSPSDSSDPATGFTIRKPVKKKVLCSSPHPEENSEEEFLQVDHVCTYKHNGKEGLIYVQATPVRCEVRMAPIPEFAIDAAQIQINGSVQDLDKSKVVYDIGGGHRNDSLKFEYDGAQFEYFHSSFGFGYRCCQPMDCAKVTVGSTLTNGCTPERTIPVVCKRVDENGQYDTTMTDTFAKCPGDLD